MKDICSCIGLLALTGAAVGPRGHQIYQCSSWSTVTSKLPVHLLISRQDFGFGRVLTRSAKHSGGALIWRSPEAAVSGREPSYICKGILARPLGIQDHLDPRTV